MTEKVNRKYKDSIFVDLFYEDESAEENEIALYNALHDEPLPEGTEIQKFRVEDVLYMNFRNDISFGVGGKLLVFGEHHEILEKCPILAEYSQFVEIVRKHQHSGEEHAFQNAVAECIERGILADYLQKKGSEAINMLIAEYDYDMDIKVQREEAKEDGFRLGEEHGIALGKNRASTSDKSILF